MFSKGDRIELVFCSDSYTRLQRGDRGTVIRDGVNGGERCIDIKWDDGSNLSMLPGAGDLIRKVGE